MSDGPALVKLALQVEPRRPRRQAQSKRKSTPDVHAQAAVPSVPNLLPRAAKKVKLCQLVRRVLVIAPGVGHESEVLAASSQGVGFGNLLDHIRFFGALLMVPSASSWSRLRHTVTLAHRPLRTRANFSLLPLPLPSPPPAPLGVPGLDHQAQTRVRKANRGLDFSDKCAE